jgi:hypothetical protein
MLDYKLYFHRLIYLHYLNISDVSQVRLIKHTFDAALIGSSTSLVPLVPYLDNTNL